MNLIKLYLLSLKKSFTLQGRASRSEFAVSYAVGIFLSLLIIFILGICLANITRPIAHSDISGNYSPIDDSPTEQQSGQLLAHSTDDGSPMPSAQLTKAKFQELSDESTITEPQQKLNKAEAAYDEKTALLTLFGFFLSILTYVVLCFAVTIRRLHDLDHSGYFYLFLLVIPVSWIMLALLLFARGTKGPNRYGLAADTLQ
jgi:uncharacterized membrane protein YhaH (DUF805 family)